MRRRSDGPGRMGDMGFTRAELESYRDVEVPDLLPAADQVLRLLFVGINPGCLLYTSPSPRDGLLSRMPSSA